MLQNNNRQSEGPPKWIAAPIVIGTLLFFALLAALLFFCRRSIRNRRNAQRRQAYDPLTDVKTPHTAAAALPSAQSPQSDGRRSASVENAPISSDQAVLMASAYRDALRKPDFPSNPTHQDSDDSSPFALHTVGGGGDGDGGQSIIERELADEGKEVHQVGGKKPEVVA